MGFTTQIFALFFMPLFFIVYMIVNFSEKKGGFGENIKRFRIKDWTLIIFSILFYCFAGIIGFIQIFFLITVLYIFARLISSRQEKGENARGIFVTGLICLVLNLVYFKYTGFILSNISGIFMEDSIVYSVIGPLGISFITFSAISYLTDVYRQDAKAGSFTDCMLFMTFFPKVVSGPIVLWKNFEDQIQKRTVTVDKTTEGINRIVVGFAKKVILADIFGLTLNKMTVGEMDQITALFSIIVYMMQIYYDFSGYSDIAIGLSKILGFEFDENFNFPYRSKSVSEFWRRWHISLGMWFRQYIYFPLGGNRKGKGRTLFNLGVVFALTGIWHGAGWNYIIWGAINGMFVIVEHVIMKKDFYKKIPDWIKYVFTMVVVMGFWQLFRFQYVEEAVSVITAALGITKASFIPYTWKYFVDNRILVFTLIGIVGATLFGSEKVMEKYKAFTSTKAGYILQEAGVIILFLISVMYMVSSTYSPFIYFQY